MLLLRKREGAVPSCHGDKVSAFPLYHRPFTSQFLPLVAMTIYRDCSPLLQLQPSLLGRGRGRGCPPLAARLPGDGGCPGSAPLVLTARPHRACAVLPFPRSLGAFKPETAAAFARTLRPGDAGRSRSLCRSAPASHPLPCRLSRSRLPHCESGLRPRSPWG